MAVVTTSFEDLAQINSAFSTINNGYSIYAALNLGQAAFDRASMLTPQAYTYNSDNKMSVIYANGDTATFYGRNMMGSTKYVTKLEYHFGDGRNVVIDGSITVSPSGYMSGYITQVSLSDNQHGTITLYGNQNIDNYNLSVSKVSWNVGGVQYEINGSISAFVGVSGGYYDSSYSGTITSGTLTAFGMSIQIIDLNADVHIGGSGEEILQTVLAGNDTVTGTGSSVSLYGFGGSDNLIGTAGNDTLDGGTGNDALDGGAGLDTAVFSGQKDNYTITLTNSGRTVSDNFSTDGTDHLANIERLEFSDKMLAFDIDNTAGQAYRIYQAAFNRTPDEGGLGFWIEQMDNGASLKQAASSFINSAEFKDMYGTNPTNAQFVKLLYNNVLHRDPDEGGFNYWMDQLNNGMPREEALIGFSESFENKVSLMAFDMDSNIGQGYRLYQAAFDRTPDLQGLNFWVSKINEAMSLKEAASHFIDSEEFSDLYGSNPTNEEFIDLLYNNVLDRDPDAGGYNYWLNQMESGFSREDVLIGFSESVENQLSLVGIVQDGIEYIGWGV